ncbi:MAG: SpoIIE family protein phosphatase [Candidatus Zixiibacteriota bacterium]
MTEHFAAFPAALDVLDDIREFVRAALWETPLDRQAASGLLLAVEEAVTNVIRHGYLFGPGRIHIRIRHTPHAVQIQMTDTGRPYEAGGRPETDLHALAETGRRGGLGVLLMHKASDRVDYRRDGDRNVLTLSKELHRSKAPAAPFGRLRTRRRLIWIAGVALTGVICAAAYLSYRLAAGDLTVRFFSRWEEFARTAAASSVQPVLNERSDAELDQLAVGIAVPETSLVYFVIVDAQGQIRADAHAPQRVHEPYAFPDGVPPGPTGHWPVLVAGEKLYHFTADMTVGRRHVGAVVLGVPQAELGRPLGALRLRIVIGALVAFGIGGVVLGGIMIGVRRPLRRLRDLLGAAKSQGAQLSAASPADEIADVVAAVNEVTAAAARSERQSAERDWARREMEQAEQLQRTLLPVCLPDIPGYQADAAYRMARHVGGDYYDILPLNDDESLWMLLVADVAGKGFPAALMMMAVRTAIRLLAPGRKDPADILAALDRYLSRHHGGGPFVTAICCVLDTERHMLSIASAGHTPLLLRSHSGKSVCRINPRGRPVGLGHTFAADDADGMRHCQSIELSIGDTVLMYTDGLSESYGRDGSALGLDRLVALVETTTGDARQTLDAILTDLGDSTQGAPVGDDITILVLRRSPETSEEPHTPGRQDAVGDSVGWPDPKHGVDSESGQVDRDQETVGIA